MLLKKSFDELRVLHFKNFAYELRSSDIDMFLRRLGALNTQLYLSCDPSTNVSWISIILISSSTELWVNLETRMIVGE